MVLWLQLVIWKMDAIYINGHDWKNIRKYPLNKWKIYGKSKDLSQCALWWCPSKIPNWGNLQHLSQHVTFDQWAHQATGLMFIIHPLSQEPINPGGIWVPDWVEPADAFCVKWNFLSWYGMINFNLIIFKTYAYIFSETERMMRKFLSQVIKLHSHSIFRCHWNSSNVYHRLP